MQITVILALVLSLSVIFNLVLAYLNWFKKKPKPLTKDAQELLHDLTEGRTILKIDVLDPAGLFYRSPRDMR